MTIQQQIERLGVPCSHAQAELLAAYAINVQRLNERLNLIARTDVQNVIERHVVHCAVLAQRPFPDGAQVVDWGTGGGFPLVPLAILRPEAFYTGVDAVEKKMLAVRSMVRSLGLTNVTTWHGRAEQFAGPHSHSVSRATAPLEALWKWHLSKVTAMDDSAEASAPATPDASGTPWPAGLICLKGGDLADEVDALQQAFPSLHVAVQPVGLPGLYFSDKYVVTVT